MPNFLIQNNFLIGTATPITPIVSAPIYEPRGVFSINASNQLQGTFWIVKNGTLMSSSITTASYQVYDKDGNTVAGLNESGISADGNAQFQITPVLATLIQDLTHYVVKITIGADSQNRIGYVGITLGE